MNFKRNFKMLPVLGLGIATLLIFTISCQTPAAAPPTPSPGLPPAPTPSPPPPQPAISEVVIEGFAFGPATITVPTGTTVTWANQDAAAHTVTSETNIFDSGNLARNDSFSYTFTERGTFKYYCTIHPRMRGEVIVE